MAKFDNLRKKEIFDALSKGKSYREVLIMLGLSSGEYNRNRLKKFIKENNIIFHSKNGGKETPLALISKESLEEIVSSSLTYREVLEKLGYSNPCTGVYMTLKNKIKRWNISTKHMTHRKIGNHEKATYNSIFSKNSTHAHSTVRNFVLRHNCVPYRCVHCGNEGEWLGKPLTLTLDHKNGDRNDNRLENLQFVCPNCDRQQDTYGSRNKRRYYK